MNTPSRSPGPNPRSSETPQSTFRGPVIPGTRRGHQIAAVAVARKLTVLCWHLLTRGEDYLSARPALVANKTRAMELQAGHPQQKGSRRGPAYAYNVKALRDQEILVAT